MVCKVSEPGRIIMGSVKNIGELDAMSPYFVNFADYEIRGYNGT